MRTSIGALVATIVLSGSPLAGNAQVFLSSAPRPEFAIGPLFIVATVRPDLGPVSVRVSWSVTLPPGRSTRDIGEALYLLWPGEVVGTTAPGAADPALRRHVEERGFTVVSEGRLALEARDRTQLGTAMRGTPTGEVASFVIFYKNATNPAQSGLGTFVKIPASPLLTDAVALMSLPMTIKDMITAKPATWVEEVFWGRRHVLTLSSGGAGSLALYSLYMDQRDRVIRLSQDFSLLIAAFLDSDHLRVEEISPSSASRRPSRVRASGETISLPIGASEGNVPQTLRVQFNYFSGPIAWRPIVVSLVLLILGNVMGALMFTQQVRQYFATRFHVDRTRGRRPRHLVPGADVLARIVPGSTTEDEVLALCGPPGEERERRRSPPARTLVYRAVQRVPHCRRRIGRLATVSHWDEEHHEVLISLEHDRVTDVLTHVRRVRVE